MRKGFNHGFRYAEVFESCFYRCGSVGFVVFDIRKGWICGFWHAELLESCFLRCGIVEIVVFERRNVCDHGFWDAEVLDSWFYSHLSTKILFSHRTTWSCNKRRHIIQVGSDFWSKTAVFSIFRGVGCQNTKYREKSPKSSEFSHFLHKIMRIDAIWPIFHKFEIHRKDLEDSLRCLFVYVFDRLPTPL